MKNKLLSAIVMFIIFGLHPIQSFSQNTGINPTGASPHNSAGLDIDFTDRGLLIPRMTTTDRNSIASSANSLLIFNTTTQCFEAYHSTTSSWVSISCLGCQLPGAFSALAATNSTQTSFDANWSGSAGATAYFLDVDDNSDFSSPVSGYDNLNVGNVTIYSVTGLTCGNTYYYRIRANNACGTSTNSNIITETITGCTTVYSVPGTYDFTVPAGVTSLEIKCWGAGGGSETALGGSGGGGGYAEGTIAVSGGETYRVVVGGGGQLGDAFTGGAGGASGGGAGGGAYAGGGGGYSGVFLTAVLQANARIVGGGGAGAGGNYNSIAPGGAGGGNTGQTGTNGLNGSTAGTGGTQIAGGVPGTNICQPTAGTAGAALQGGNGATGTAATCYGGGGGGAGFFGGGGGGGGIGGTGNASGGGGGSNFVSGASTQNVQAVGATAANNGDPDYASPAGNGGVPSGGAGNVGNPGRVVLNY